MLLIKLVAVATTSLSFLNAFIQGHEEPRELTDGRDYDGFFANIVVYCFVIGYAIVGLYALWMLASEKNYLAIGATFTCIYEIESYSKIPGALKDGGIRAKVRFKKRALNIVATLPLLIFAFSN